MKPEYKLPAAITLVGILTIISVIVNIQRNQRETRLQQAQPLIVNSTQLIQKGNYADARTSLEKALEITPENAITQNNLGFTCQQLKDFACTETHFKEAIRLNPKNWQFYKNLASLYDIQQRYLEARTEYQKTLELTPAVNQPAVIADFSRLLNRTTNYSEALSQAESALSKTQNTEVKAALLSNIAWSYWKTGNREKAQKIVRESITQQETVDNLCLLSQIEASPHAPVPDRALKACRDKVQLTLSQNPRLLEFRPEIQTWSQADRT